MKAIVCDRYGAPEALRLHDVDKPTPGDGQVLIQVRAASLNAYDWGLLRGRPRMLRLMVGPAQTQVQPTRSGRVRASRVRGSGRDPVQAGRRGLWDLPRVPRRVCVCLGIGPGHEA